MAKEIKIPITFQVLKKTNKQIVFVAVSPYGGSNHKDLISRLVIGDFEIENEGKSKNVITSLAENLDCWGLYTLTTKVELKPNTLVFNETEDYRANNIIY